MAYAIEARQFWSNLRLNECIIVVVLRLQLNYSMVIVPVDDINVEKKYFASDASVDEHA